MRARADWSRPLTRCSWSSNRPSPPGRRPSTPRCSPPGFAAKLGVFDAFGDRGVRICSDERNHASILGGGAPVHGGGGGVPPPRRRASRQSCCARRRDPPSWSPKRCSRWTATSPPSGTSRRRVAVTVPCWSSTRPMSSSAPTSAPSSAASTSCAWGRLSKTLGSLGAFVAGRRAFIDLLVHRAPSYVFSSGPTPADSAAALAALGLLPTPEGDRLRTRLTNNIARVARGTRAPSSPYRSGPTNKPWPRRSALRDHGVWVPAISSSMVAPAPPACASLSPPRTPRPTSWHSSTRWRRCRPLPTTPPPSTSDRVSRCVGPAHRSACTHRPGATRTIFPNLPPWAKRS